MVFKFSIDARPFFCALAASLCLMGCARNFVFEDLHVIYQSPEIPTVFANDSGGWQASVTLTRNAQRPLIIPQTDTGLDPLSANPAFLDAPCCLAMRLSAEDSIPKEYRFQSNKWFAEGTLAWAFKFGFFGVTAGAALPDWKRLKVGGFLGYSQNLEILPVTPFVSIGCMATRVEITGNYLFSDYEFTHAPISPHRGYAVQKRLTDFSIPTKFGMMLRLSAPFQPYVFFYSSRILTVPDEQLEPERYMIDDSGFAGGVRNEIFPSWLLSLESYLGILTAPGDFESRYWKSKVMLTRKI